MNKTREHGQDSPKSEEPKKIADLKKRESDLVNLIKELKQLGRRKKEGHRTHNPAGTQEYGRHKRHKR